MAYEDRILRMVRQKESAPFNDAKDRFRARTKRQRFPGRFPRRALQKQDRGLGSFENQMMMDQLRGPAGMDTPPSTQKKRFLNMITLPGGSPDQEFFDTYGTPMRGNIEYDSMAYPGEKIYGLGDRLTRNIMLDSNNLRNYELGKTPIINPDTNLPYGYELEGPDEDRWMTPEDSLGGSRPMTDASGWKPFWDYITGGLFKNRGGIASLRR